MSSKRSAVEPSECENVALKKVKKKKPRSSTRDFIREVKSPPYTTVKKRINAGALQKLSY